MLEVWGAEVPPKMTTLFVKLCYFDPVLTCAHDYMNHFNMKWKENQFGGRKVVGRATMVRYWAQKVGGQLSALPIGCAANARDLTSEKQL